MKYIIIWLMMGLAGAGIASQLRPNKPMNAGVFLLFTTSGGLSLLLTSSLYVYELNVWNKCIINCKENK